MVHMGGPLARAPHGATAYSGRDVAHDIVIDAAWLPEEGGAHAATEAARARRFLPGARGLWLGTGPTHDARLNRAAYSGRYQSYSHVMSVISCAKKSA